MPTPRTFSFILSAAVLLSAEAWGKDCSKEDAVVAESVPYFIESWHKMHEAFDHFGHCDDGSIAEAFSDSIVHLLASHWERLPELVRETRSASSFETFVLRHIDATAATEDLNRVEFLASHKCPKDNSALCEQIERTVKESGREL